MADADLNLSHTSDGLHNENCYHYLNHLIFGENVLAAIKKDNPALHRSLLELKSAPYQTHVAYGDLYHQFFKAIEKNIEDYKPDSLAYLFDDLVKKSLDPSSVLSAQERVTLQELSDFFFSLYANDSQILESTFNAIKAIPLNHVPVMPNIQKTISRYISNEKKINKTHSPLEIGRPLRRLLTLFKANYKPQHSTNLASIRLYDYIKKLTESGLIIPKEYRFGTQGQFHKGDARISPVFEQWLKVLAFKQTTNPNYDQNKTHITHVYINNLGLDRTDFAGLKESQLTKKLHELEVAHPNLCVITLPAEKGLLHITDYKKISDTHSAKQVYQEFLDILLDVDDESTSNLNELGASSSPGSRCIKDFYISPRIRQRLFTDQQGYSKTIEKQTLENLLKTSFNTFGLSTTGILTSAQKQAVWFHFLKFELTSYILNTLNPDSVNFTCKDAIDRGGVSSAYYNLLQSFQAHCPMSREEFERALHAAPTLVKGRGINHHLHLIWNVIDNYLDNPVHYDAILTNPAAEWLIEWRDLNCPKKRVPSLLSKRLSQARKEIQSALEKTDNSKEIALFTQGHDIIDNIIKQQALNIHLNDKRLFLETVTRTVNILFKPTQINLHRYTEVIKKLSAHSCFSSLKKAMHFILLSIMDLFSNRSFSYRSQYSAFLRARKQTIQSMKELQSQSQQILDEDRSSSKNILN